MKISYRIPPSMIRFATEWYVTGHHVAYQNDLWADRSLETMYKRLRSRFVDVVLNLQDVPGEIYPFDIKQWMTTCGASTVILPNFSNIANLTYAASCRQGLEKYLRSDNIGVCPQSSKDNRNEWISCAKTMAKSQQFDHIIVPWYAAEWGSVFGLIEHMRSEGLSHVRNWYVEGIHGKVYEYVLKCRSYGVNLITRAPFILKQLTTNIELDEDFSKPISEHVERNTSLAIARRIGEWTTN